MKTPRTLEELRLIGLVADEIAAGVWVATVPDGHLAYVNKAFQEIMGMSPVPEQKAGSYSGPYGIYDREGSLYPEERLPFARAVEARATVVVDDLVIHRRDGTRVFVRAHAKPIFDERGEMTHVTIAFFDITRELVAEEQARGAEDWVRRVVTSAPLVLFSFDREGVLEAVEGRALGEVGANPEDLVGLNILRIAASSPAISAIRRALDGEAVAFADEFRGRAFEVKLQPSFGEKGVVTQVFGVATDITERRMAELQLAKSERLASMGLLAAGLAHEVNNPLSYVLGNLELVARDLASSGGTLSGASLARLQARLADAREGAERVRRLVKDLKTFSRVDRGKPSTTAIEPALEAAISMCASELRTRAPLVRDARATPAVRADEGRLSQVFLNLLVNAAHAIPEKGNGRVERSDEVRVTTRTDEAGNAVVEIADTGVGIAAEDLPRVFDPFFTTKAVGEGTGLGLSISNAIVVNLGGRIEIESEAGRGSVVRVVLPPAPADDDGGGAGDRQSDA